MPFDCIGKCCLLHLAPLAAGRSHMRNVRYGICSLLSSCPALGRASTSHFVPAHKTWMGGGNPAMTMPKKRPHSGHSSYAIPCPPTGEGAQQRKHRYDSHLGNANVPAQLPD